MLIDAHAPQEVIEFALAAAAKSNEDSDFFDVWEECWASVQFYCALRTQWVWISTMSSARRVGLDYCRVESTMRMQGVSLARRAALLHDVRIMENAALEYWAEQD